MIQKLKELLAERRELEQQADQLTQAEWGTPFQTGAGLKISKGVIRLQKAIDKIIDEL